MSVRCKAVQFVVVMEECQVYLSCWASYIINYFIVLGNELGVRIVGCFLFHKIW